MKNYFMRLIVLHIAFITCNIIAMEKQPLSLLEQSLDFFSGIKFETKGIINNRLLIIGHFKTSEELVQETQKIALDLYTKTDEPILLCPNMEYSRTDNNRHWVVVERYIQRLDKYGNCLTPIEKARDTFYQVGFDSRELSNHQLIMYDLHPKALQVVPEIGNKSSIENSKDKHMEELSFMFHNKDSAPVVVCVNEACVPENKMKALYQAFESGDVEGFINCLQCVEEEQKATYETEETTVISLDTKKSSFRIGSLKILFIPVALLLISYLFYIKVKNNF